VGEAIGVSRGALAAREVTLSTRLAGDLPPVNGDRIQLVQVLLNLIANACEEMERVEPRRRFIVVTTAKSADGMVCVSVADSGPGIASERAAMLFEPFFTTKEQGLGLGLSISRSIVTAHGGRLWADNRPQGGAIFHVSIPAYREAAE
jgi:C4-dicarboxylate-specific signal transduction histidine kinase